MNTADKFESFEKKMKAAGLPPASIMAFKTNYLKLINNESTLIPESSIDPIEKLPEYSVLPQKNRHNPALLSKTLIIKLNGGLGTSMGLDKAKSLLTIKDGYNFLDLIARHILHLRQTYQCPLRLLFLNSFNTSSDTREYLKKYPELPSNGEIELIQNRVPKIDTQSFGPAQWPANPQLEWCPPGHGDLYPSLWGSGLLNHLIDAGIRYVFVANSDNRGASLDPTLLDYFASSNLSFLMEVTHRTSADTKGGHLAKRRSNGKLLLREYAQCPSDDLEAFQDIHRHRFFNTNSIWLRLDHLKKVLDANGGCLSLPLIKNLKTIDPQDKKSPQVYQLETAVGSAIECFENTGAIVVTRKRFSPVKTTSDLFVLRSDAYQIAPDFRLALDKTRKDIPPIVKLDPEHYGHADQLDSLTQEGVPSLKNCHQLTVHGPVIFNKNVIIQGNVTLSNPSPTPKKLPAGVYKDETVEV